VRDTRAPVVTYKNEPAVTQRSHHRNLVLRDHALGIIGMVVAPGLLTAIPIAAEIRGYDAEMIS
jgi:hypothetical protein